MTTPAPEQESSIIRRLAVAGGVLFALLALYVGSAAIVFRTPDYKRTLTNLANPSNVTEEVRCAIPSGRSLSGGVAFERAVSSIYAPLLAASHGDKGERPNLIARFLGAGY